MEKNEKKLFIVLVYFLLFQKLPDLFLDGFLFQ